MTVSFKVRLAIIVLCAVTATTALSAQPGLERLKAAGVVRLGVTGEPPYSILSSNGEFTGAEPDIAKLIFSRLGVPKVSGTPVDFAALIPGLQAGHFDMVAAGLYIRPDRCKVVPFSRPLLCSGEGLLVKKGNSLGITTYQSIVEKKARFGGLSSGIEVKRALDVGVPRDHVLGATDIVNALKLLQDGRVDALGFPEMSLSKALESTDGSQFELIRAVSGEPVGCSGAAFNQQDRDIRDAFDSELDKMKKSGEFARIPTNYKMDPTLTETQSREGFCQGPN
jgi:polar amino acid transport system substrate-binding protein